MLIGKAMKKYLLAMLAFSSSVNSQGTLSIPVQVQDVQINASVIIKVKLGCNLTGWQSVNDDTHRFFVSCGKEEKSITFNNLGKMDNVSVLKTEQDEPISIERSGSYGIDWDKVRKNMNNP